MSNHFSLLQNNTLQSVKHNKNNLPIILNPKMESELESFFIIVKVSALSSVVCTNFPSLKPQLERALAKLARQ